MGADMNGFMWTMVIVDSAVGMGMLIYGWRQKEPMELVMGIVLSVLPMVPGPDLAMFAYNILVGMLYFAAKRFL